MMPGLSGMEVLRKIHEDSPETSVVMVTAVADMATAVEAMKLGAYDYITKPFDLDDVVATVLRALERRSFLLERKQYQVWLEREVAEKTAHLDQKIQEMTALNSMIQSRLDQVFATRDTYERAITEIKDLERRIRELAEATGLLP
jgi:DNA-binding NtrC family response regulator